jgi:hypothetical protein
MAPPFDLDQCTAPSNQTNFCPWWVPTGIPCESCDVSDIHEAQNFDGLSSLLRVDQRRPGRPNRASPALLPLLRGEAVPVGTVDPGPEDGLALAKGIAVGLLISVPIWALIFWSFRGIGLRIAPG